MTLSEYVQRIMREKGYSARDVAKNSRTPKTNGISHAYVTKIAAGEMNLSIDKIKSLAIGLGVSEDELFDVARGRLNKLADEITRDQQWICQIYADLSPIERHRFKIMTETFLLSASGSDVHMKTKSKKAKK